MPMCTLHEVRAAKFAASSCQSAMMTTIVRVPHLATVMKTGSTLLLNQFNVSHQHGHFRDSAVGRSD